MLVNCLIETCYIILVALVGTIYTSFLLGFYSFYLSCFSTFRLTTKKDSYLERS